MWFLLLEKTFSGDYPMVKNMNVSDLIIASGGMKESAFSLSAEISRVLIDSSANGSNANIPAYFAEFFYQIRALWNIN